MPQYTEDELFAKLQRADAAGDVQAAKVIADEIRRTRWKPTRRSAGDIQAHAKQYQQENPVSPFDGLGELRDSFMRGDQVRGAYNGLEQAAYGLGQVVARGGFAGELARQGSDYLYGDDRSDFGRVVSDAIGRQAASRQAQFEQTQAGQATLGKVGNVIGSTAPALAMPANAPTLLGRLGLATAGGAAAGASQPVTGGDYATEKLKQTGIGAAAGLGGQGIIGEPLRFGVRGLAALFSKGAPNISPEAAQALQYADQNGLPIYADDLMASPAMRGAGVFVDDVPIVGGAGVRREQSEAARGAAQQLVSRFPSKGGADTLAASAEAQLRRANDIKRRLYDGAFAKLDTPGMSFKLPQTRQQAQALIAAEQGKGSLADAGLIRELQKYVESPNFNFKGWHGARAELGSTIRDLRTGDNALLSSRAGSVLQQLKGTMDRELSAIAAKSPGGANAWRRADAFYRETLAPYRKGPVASAMKSADPDSLANRILGNRDSDAVARQFYNALDKSGREEVRGALLEQAMQRSMKQVEGGEPVFSPGEMANQLKAIESRVGKFFTPAERAEIRGLQNYLAYTRKAGHYAANPATGRRVLTHGAVLASTGAVNPTAAAGYGSVAGFARLLLRTQNGRDLLLKLGSSSPGTRAAEEAIQQLNALMERSAASEAGHP